MRRWGLYLTLLVMGLVLAVYYYFGLKSGRVDGNPMWTIVYNWVVPVVFVVLAGWLSSRMFAYKNRDRLMVVASFILGLMMVAGLFTGFAHNGGKQSAEQDMHLNDAKKAVQSAINNWDIKKNGSLDQVIAANGTVNYKALGFGGCPGANELNADCAYKFVAAKGADGSITVDFAEGNRAENSVVDPVLGSSFGVMPEVGVFSLLDLLAWLGFVVALSSNIFLLMESYVGVEMPVDLIYEEGVEAR